MAGRNNPHRKPQDIGKDSPATGEAKRQGITGAKGGPRAAQVPGRGKQPPQSSGRRSRRHEQAPREAKSFTPEESPVEQGLGEPSPERLAARSSQQGIEPRCGGHRSQGEETEEISSEGPPAHNPPPREGRQHGGRP
jgi:hypothetical protein